MMELLLHIGEVWFVVLSALIIVGMIEVGRFTMELIADIIEYTNLKNQKWRHLKR